MRKCLLVLAVVAAVAAPASAQVGKFKIEQIEPAVIRTPVYNFQGDDRRLPEGSSKSWIEVQVKFSSEVPFTDELVVKYYILLAKQVLVGEVTHINIPAGKELYSVMYVPPRTLERLLKGKPVSKNAIDNIAVQLSAKGALVAQESLKKASNPTWFQTLPNVPSLVLNKNQTPFAPLYWDRYEMIKPEGR